MTLAKAPLYYYIGTDGRYSYGPMAQTVYISCAIYIIAIYFRLYKKGGSIFDAISQGKCKNIYEIKECLHHISRYKETEEPGERRVY